MSKFDTVLPADCVLNVKLNQERNILLCGTYFLKENITDERGRTRAIRKGEILALSYPEVPGDGAQSESAKVLGRSDFESGVLDIQPLSTLVSFPATIATAHSNGEVRIIAVTHTESDSTGEAVVLDCKSTATLQKNDESAVLALAVSTGIHGQPEVASNTLCVSDSIGQISTFTVSDGGVLSNTRVWKAHEFECWTVDWAWRDAGCGLLASGGDDTRFCLWDARTDCAKAASTVRFHEAGVCAAQWHPTEPNLLASGSYDEQLALWDVRSLAKPLVTQRVGGGVWRIRWLMCDQAPANIYTLLTATMYAGAHVVTADVGAATARIVKHYRGHESIVYGAEWLPQNCALGLGDQRDRSFPIATCSFYDHSLHFWNTEVGDEIHTAMSNANDFVRDFAATKI